MVYWGQAACDFPLCFVNIQTGASHRLLHIAKPECYGIVGLGSEASSGASIDFSMGTKQGNLLARGFRRISRSSFTRSSLTLASATAAAQAAALLVAPLITRLYTPEEFGQQAFFLAVVGVLSPLVCLCYELAIPMSSEGEEATDLVRLCIFVNVIMSGLIGIVALLAWPSVTRRFGMASLGASWVLFPLLLSVTGLFGIISSWHVKFHAYSDLARMRFVCIAGIVFFQAALGCTLGGALSLLVAQFLAYGSAVISGVMRVRVPPLAALTRRREPKRLRQVAAAYRAFALQTTPSAVISVAGSWLPNIVLPLLYGPNVAGSYALANRAMGQPATLLGQSVGSVFLGQAARLIRQDPERLWRLFLAVNGTLMAVILPGVTLVFWGGEIFSLVFGSPWNEAGTFAGIMFLGAFVAVAGGATECLTAYRLNHWQAVCACGRVALLAGTLGASWFLSWSSWSCIFVLSLATAMHYAVLLFLNGLAIRRANYRRTAAISSSAACSRSGQ